MKVRAWELTTGDRIGGAAVLWITPFPEREAVIVGLEARTTSGSIVAHTRHYKADDLVKVIRPPRPGMRTE